MSAGRLRVVGLGPGPADWLVPEAAREITEATDIVGYAPYVDRLALRPGQVAHASDNRVELGEHLLSLGQCAQRDVVAGLAKFGPERTHSRIRVRLFDGLGRSPLEDLDDGAVLGAHHVARFVRDELLLVQNL